MDCIDYYGEKEADYTKECDYQKVWAFRHTLGIAFVTFENEQVANKCVLNLETVQLTLRD